MGDNLEKDKWNKLLPYQTDPPNAVFAEIKSNIAQAVQQKDLTRGLKFWSDQLSTFIKIYGYQIPKSDLIILIKLYYSLIIDDDINIAVLGMAGKSFVLLLKLKVKKHIKREDLVLEWRPLYQVCKEIFFGKDKTYSLKVGYVQLENTIRNVVTSARDYFPDGATAEMLAEWEPLICPNDSMAHRATTFISMFMPVTCDPDTGFRLWFDLVVGLMKTTSVSFPTLLCRVAKFNIGKIDWKPHIPWVFNMILHDMNLPVGEAHTFAGLPIISNKLCSTKIEIIVWMMGSDSTEVVMEHLRILTQTYHSYLHPSNRGRWTLKLVGFVNCVCQVFLKRIEMERHEQETWFKKVPESHMLSQEDINQFVQIILPSVKMAMFNNSHNFQHDYQCLVRLAPQIVLPDFVERAYESIESIIEPQRVTTALCSFAVSLRSLCLHEPSKQHIVPLLGSLLNTISSNDLTKSWIALLAFSFAFTMIPVVDCSHLLDQPGKRKKDLERTWRSTAQFKDIVAVFVDKLMSLIEVSAMEDTGNLNSVNHKTRSNKNFKNVSSIPDYLAEGSIYMSFDSLLRNSSDDIRDMILDKVFRYVTTTTLEVKIAGKTMGDALSNLSNTYTEKTLKKFMPYLIRECNMLLDEETSKGDTSVELLWNMTMLRSILRGRGDCFLPYLDDMQALFERCFKFHNSLQLITIVVKALSDMLYLLMKLKTKEFRSCQVPYTDKTFDFTTTWGVGMKVNEVELDWFIPGPAEYAAINQIIERFGVSALTNLTRFVAERNTCKEEFQVQLKVLRAVQKTAGHMMPMLGGHSPVKLPEFGGRTPDEHIRVPIKNLNLATGIECNSELVRTFRSRAAEVVKNVFDYLTDNLADDTKSFEIICVLLEDILTYKGYDSTKMKKEHTKYKSVKQMLDDKLAGKKKQLRMVVIHRVYLQQQYRQHAQLYSPYTEEHDRYTQCLVQMALSNYTVVRKTAQYCLKKCLSVMLYSRAFFLRDIIKYLDPDKGISHEQLKGALFSLCMPRLTSFLVPQPHLFCDVIPAICKAQHSEKDSIINAIEHLIDYLMEEYRTICFSTRLPESTVTLASQLAGPLPEDKVQQGLEIARHKDETNRKCFNLCIERLLEILKNNKTTWRFLDLTADVIRLMIQRDMNISEDLVKTFLQFLTHDSIGLRIISFRVISYVIYLRRRVYKETVLDPSTFADDGEGPQVGERPSNFWLQYRKENLPKSEEQYKDCVFVDKPHVGYNKWPKKLTVCIELDYELENTNRYSPIDKLIVDCFKDPEFISRFIELYSLEDNKGAEKTDIIRRHFYRDLFRNYGWSLFELFRPKVEEFVAGKIESQHRFAAELVSSVTRGSKHWPFKDIQLMWNTILPLIMTAMQTVSSETLNMWVVCISSIVEDRDPRRFSLLIDTAKSEFLAGRTIFHDTVNLHLLEILIAQFEWKFAEELHELLEKITANLNNSYKTVRDKLGCIIDRCTGQDTLMYGSRPTISPRKEDFMAAVMPMLTSLDEGLFGTEWVVVNKLSLSDDNDAIKVVKTLTSWLMYSRLMHTRGDLVPAIFPFISYVIALEPNEVDQDLKHLCTKTLSSLSRESLSEVSLGPAIDGVKKVVVSEERTVGCTWKAKCTALVYLQVMSFTNLYMLRSNQEMVSDIKSLLVTCLESSQVEVRQTAAMTIGGLMKTSLFNDINEVLNELKEMARTPLPKGTKKSQTDIREIWIRHGAISAMCALVESFPYSIPEWLPETLVFLAKYTRGNVMIANGVKKSMSNFKRTHLDSWEEHKGKFTEEQLIVLQDLLVSPNYYA